MRSVTTLIIAVMLGLTGVTQVGAADVPQAGKRDNRVRFVDYHQDEVIIIYVQKGAVSRLILEDGEQIEVAATGQVADCNNPQANWCLRADQGTNEIWVKPREGASHNNLELRTNRRDYSIEFKLAPEERGHRGSHIDKTEAAMYRVIFTYPVPIPNMSTFMAAKVANPQVSDATVLQARLKEGQAVARNWNYSQQAGQGSGDIAPSLVFDDGRFTYFKFPNNRDIPTLFYVTPSGEEERVNYHMEGEWLVVERTGQRFVIRLGHSVIGIWNDGFEPNGVAPVAGTTISGVERGIK